jgi:small subunit ribosomal protein S16
MLKIRLQRIGRRNEAHFRIIVTEHTRATNTGDFVERVGTYNPKTKKLEIDAERITHWIKNGAQASDTVHNMLINKGIIKGKKRNVLPKKTVPKKEEEPAPIETAPAAETPASTEESAPVAESTEPVAETV